MAVSREMDFDLDRNALHQVIVLRNAFAHHASNAHPVFDIGKTSEEDASYLQFWVLENSGKISHRKRREAFDEFNAAFRKARDSLIQLKNHINKRYSGGDAEPATD